MNNKKYCKHCGQLIDIDCVICIHCGKQVEELKTNSEKNIIINNSASSNLQTPEKKKKKYNLDFIYWWTLVLLDVNKTEI